MNYCKLNAYSAPADVRAESGELFCYEFDDEYNGICLLKYNGDKIQINRPEHPELEEVQHLVVPREINGLPVVGVDCGCFEIVHYPPIYFPESIKYFREGSEKKAAIFDHHVTISSGTEKIGSSTFMHCIGLKSVTIPASVTLIEKYAFYYCEALESISIDEENPVYSDVEGLLYNKDKTVLIKCPMGKSGNLAIPHSVVKIADAAFSDCTSLSGIIMPESLKTIGGYSFSGCSSLAEIAIPKSVIEIGVGAFKGNEVALRNTTTLHHKQNAA